jgi:alkaline phosphatase D
MRTPIARLAAAALATILLAACGDDPAGSFHHGVASGDPTADAVILWTRVTPPEGEAAPEALPVQWVLARDEELRDVVAEGTAEARAEHDYTVKVDATGLAPGGTYFYRFASGEAHTVVGRTRTLPQGQLQSVTLAFVSCSNYPLGYFNVYKAIAQRDDVDAVLHLGDYYYEYAADGWGEKMGEKLGRVSVPAHETVTLEDYRLRHAQYRGDPDLQAMTARHPLIAVWDDHESSNDSSADAAPNQKPEDGDWQTRKRASAQAYSEWLPIRNPAPANPVKIYRAFEFGDLASLFMLDTRLIGRAPSLEYDQPGAVPLVSRKFDFSDPEAPVPAAEDASGPAVRAVPVPFDLSSGTPQPVLDYARIAEYGETAKRDVEALPENIVFLPDAEAFRTDVLNDPSRRMLGAEQEEWLRQGMSRSRDAGKPWQILAQQVLVGSLVMPDLSPELKPIAGTKLTETRIGMMGLIAREELPLNLDSWDGYQAARRDLAADIMEDAENAVILAGDTHNFYAFDLDTGPDSPVYAAEFGASSVSSPGMESFLPVPPDFARERLLRSSRQLRYMDPSHRGYALLTVTPDKAVSRFYFVDTVESRDFQVTCAKAFAVAAKPGPGVAAMEEVACQ